MILYKPKYIKNLRLFNGNLLVLNRKYTYSLKNNISKIYINSWLNKYKILRENKDKSGVYRWVSLTSNKSYVGSSTNITKRLRKYYNINYLKSKIKKDNSLIYRALLKHGYSNFNLEILEYCSKTSLINREQYYLDLLKPEYNICKIAGSMLGFKHSAKTLLKFKNRDTGTGYETMIINEEKNIKKTYSSLRTAAKSIGVSHTTLIRYYNKNKLLNNLYFIKSQVKLR